MTDTLNIPLAEGTNAAIVHSALMRSNCFLSKDEISALVQEKMKVASIPPTLTALRANGLVEWRRPENAATKRTFEWLGHSEDHPIPPQDPIIPTFKKEVKQRVIEEPYHKASDIVAPQPPLDGNIPPRDTRAILNDMLNLQIELQEAIKQEITTAKTGCLQEFEAFLNREK